MPGSKLIILTLVSLVFVEAIEAHRRSCKSSSSSEECCPCPCKPPKKCPGESNAQPAQKPATSTTTSTTTTTPRFSIDLSPCRVNLKQFKCKNNECPAEFLGQTKYCCCAPNFTGDAVKLGNQSSSCTSEFETPVCSAIAVKCVAACDSDGFCKCVVDPCPSSSSSSLGSRAKRCS